MNKDVIYIEPEDDITDIISKLENSKEKIVALVPPKKAGVLRSVVNIKLIIKAASGANKTVVFVTTDPSIIKIAAMVQTPVTKDLQTAPVIPSSENISESENIEISAPAAEEQEEASADDSSEKSDIQSPEPKAKNREEKEEKPFTKDKKSSKKLPKWLQWFKDHKKLSIICGCALIVIIIILIWALVIAPAVTISVTIKTSNSNFSENVSLVSDIKSENSEEGTFFYDTKKKESKQEVTFTATGSKNVGEKAAGKVVVYAYFKEAGSVSIDTNSTFTYQNRTYVATASDTLSWDYNGNESCINRFDPSIATYGCLRETSIPVIAAEPGSNYNLSPSTNGWSTNVPNAGARTDEPIAGGTDNIVTVVTEEDIKKAQESFKTTGHTKESFLDEISEDETLLVVTQSYKETTSDPVASPAIGEEVKSGVTPKLTVTATQSVFVLDKTKVEEFISKKAKLGEDQKIYSIKDPFIENLSEKESGFTGKLKTTFKSGSKVTENDILENVKGKKVGEVKAILSSISGVVKDNTKIETSYFWVSTVPNDPNKITINLEIKED